MPLGLIEKLRAHRAAEPARLVAQIVEATRGTAIRYGGGRGRGAPGPGPRAQGPGGGDAVVGRESLASPVHLALDTRRSLTDTTLIPAARRETRRRSPDQRRPPADAGRRAQMQQVHANLPEDLRRGQSVRLTCACAPALRSLAIACRLPPRNRRRPRCPETPHRPSQGQGSTYAENSQEKNNHESSSTAQVPYWHQRP